MKDKIALIVSDLIESVEETHALYQVYKVDKLHSFDFLIEQAKNDGFKAVFAFASEDFELCGINPKKSVRTFVTKCNGKAADFYVKQAKRMIKAKMELEDVAISLTMGIRNSAYSMMREYQAYIK